MSQPLNHFWWALPPEFGSSTFVPSIPIEGVLDELAPGKLCEEEVLRFISDPKLTSEYL
jgi:hypothetical protein